jgi:non-specific serine/threonine protein kinase
VFVGRAKELDQVVELVRGGSRLVVLTGPGGSGKSRLAVEAADVLRRDFDDGLYWVPLAAVRDPRMVVAAMAGALRTSGEVAQYVGDGRILMVVDNFEQVVDAGADLTELLDHCRGLHLLVTSRELLRVRGELEYPVLGLEEPEAVRLFCIRSGLPPDEAVSALCGSLDNLPLAVELAAARTKVLSPRQILERVSERLDLFRGNRGAEPRQLSLRATIDWSYRLLAEGERALFARLAAFDGGFSLEAAQAVAGAELDTLQSLVDKNLLRHEGERFWMLETVREFAREALRASGDAEVVRRRHVGWFLGLVDAIESRPGWSQHDRLRAAIEEDFDNLRLAFSGSLESGDVDAALRFVGGRRVWESLQGHLAEGIAWVEAALSSSTDAASQLRGRALSVGGDFRRVQGDFDGARHYLEQADEIQRGCGDIWGLGVTLYVMGRVQCTAGRLGDARAATEESLSIARELEDRQAIAQRTAQLAEIAFDQDEWPLAQTFAEEALIDAKAVGDSHTVAEALCLLGMLSAGQGDTAGARSRLPEALGLQQSLRDWNCASVSLAALGDVALRDGRSGDAAGFFRQSLQLQRGLGQWYRALDSLWGLAAAAADDNPRRAVRLLGAEARLRADSAVPFRLGRPDHRAEPERSLRRRMHPDDFTASWGEGLAMSRNEALDDALSSTADGVATAPAPRLRTLTREGEYWTVRFDTEVLRLKDSKGVGYLARLLASPGREIHVLELAAEGGTNRSAPLEVAAGGRLHVEGSGNLGPLLDDAAKASYRARLASLQEDLDEATTWSDPVRAEKIRAEMDFMVDELAAATGLRGRNRPAAEQSERARVNITRAVKSVLGRVRADSPLLGAHLDATIRTGVFCSYSPDPRVPIPWDIQNNHPLGVTSH